MSVDSRVVSLTFDNKQFEEAVKQTLSSLQTLDEALRNVDSGKALSGLGDAANDVDLSSIESGVDNISNKFSTLGVIGTTALVRVTNAAINLGKSLASTMTSSIFQGGLTRALNIEQAEFLFEGLGVSVQKAMTSASNAVDQTAYSLDAAAKVGASLTASGVKAGPQLEKALRGVAGMAAVTGSDFQSVGDIFATVAGNGRLMSQELLQFSSRGLNAAAIMTKYGEYAGKTEQEIRELVTQGKVSFKQFSDAMYEAFGEQATKANETFTGALSNMKTALARIGASLFGGVANSFYVIPKESVGVLENLRKIFVALMPIINNLNKALTPFIVALNTRLTSATDAFVKKLGALEKITNKFSNKTDGIKEFLNSFKNIKGLDSIFSEIEKKGKLTTDTLQMFEEKGINMASILGKAMGKSEKEIRKMVENGKIDFDTFKTAIDDSFGKLWTEQKFSGIIDTIKGGAKAIKDFGTSSKTLSSFKDIFSGIVSAFKILMNVGKVVFNILKPIVSTILSIAAAIGRLITSISKATNVGNSILGVSESVGGALEGLGNIIQTVISLIGSGLSAAFRAISGILKSFGKYVSGAFEGLDSLSAVITGAGLVNALMVLNYQMTKMKFTFKSVTDIFNGFKSWSKSIKAIGDLPNDISTILSNVKRTLIGFQNDLNAGALMKLGVGILAIAVALKILSNIDMVGLTKGLSAVTIIMIEFQGMLSFLTSLAKTLDPKTAVTITSIANSLIKIAAAILILSFAIKNLSSLSFKELAVGLIGITVALAALAGFVIAVGKFDKTGGTKTGIAIMAIATGLVIMSEAIEKLGQLNTRDLVEGLSGIVIILAAIMGFSVGMEKLGGKLSLKTAVAIIAIAQAISMMASSVKKISSLNPKELAVGLVGISALMAAMIGLSAGLEKFGGAGLIASGIGLVVIAKSIQMLVEPLKTLGSMKLENLGKGLGSLAIGLAAMAAASQLTSAVGAGGIFVIASAMALLATTIEKIGSMDVSTIAKGFAVMAGSFALFGAAAAILTPVIPAMLALGAAMIVLSAAVAILGAGLLMIGAGLTSVAAGIMSFASLSITALSSFKATFEMFVTMVANAIPIMAKAIAEGFISFLQVITESAGKILPFITEMIGIIITAITENVPKLVETGIFLLTTFLEGIRDNIQTVTTLGIEIIVGFINGIAEGVPQLIQAGANLVISFINGLADGIRENAEAVRDAIINLCTAILEAFMSFFGIASPSKVMQKQGVNLIQGLINGIKEKISSVVTTLTKGMQKALKAVTKFVSNFLTAGKSLITNLISGIKSKVSSIATTISSGISKAVSKVKSFVGQFINAGRSLISGVASGIRNGISSVISAVGSIASRAISAFKDKLKINSPSKVFAKLGGGIPEGIAKGVKETSNLVTNSIGDLTTAAIDKMGSAMNSLKDFGETPSITPIMDLSEIQNGMKSISGLQTSIDASVGNISLNTPKNPNSDIVKAINKLRSDIENINNNTYNINGITYDDGSNITTAVETLVRATKIEGRV